MSLVRNIAFMGSSTAMRLGFGLLTFVVMARLLGPDRFGLVMLWLSAATIATLAANFGFTPYVLREIGVKPESAEAVMGEVLTAKLLLSIGVIVPSLAALFWVSDGSRLVFIALLVALLADSMTEFLNVGFRATNRFVDEARLATVASALQFAMVAGATWLDPRAETAAVALMLSRAVVTAMTLLVQRRHFTGLRCAPVAAGIRRVRDAVAFATDFGLQSLFGQIDSVVLNHFAGPAAVGVYQAGMRMFLAGAQAATVIGNVLIPHVAGMPLGSRERAKGFFQTILAFVSFGVIGGIAFALLPDRFVVSLFGESFRGLSDLLPMFGLLFVLRFAAGGIGVQLTIEGHQRSRAICTLMHWIAIGAATGIAGISGGKDWIAVMLLGNALLIALYVFVLLITGQTSVTNG